MKRRALVALLVTAAVIGGLLLLFPAEWVALLLALLALLTAQAVLILRHTRVLPQSPDSSLKPKFSTSMLREQSVARRASAAAAPGAGGTAPASAGPEAEPVGAAAAPGREGALPTAELFSRFRSHLETMERGTPVPGATPGTAGANAPKATPAGSAGSGGDAVTDRVELSSAAKRGPAAPRPGGGSPAAAGNPKPAAPKVPASATGTAAPSTASAAAPAPAQSSGGEPAPAAEPRPAPASAAKPAPAVATASRPGAAGRPGAASRTASRPDLMAALKSEGNDDEETDLFADLRPELAVGRAGRKPAGADAAPTGPAHPPPPRDEVGEALERAREPQTIREEGAALVRIAEEALDAGDLRRAKALFDQYEALVADAPELASWEAARAQLRLASREGRAEAAAPSYQAMLDRGFAPKEESLEAEIDALLEGLPAESKVPAKVGLMVKALAPFRQAGDRAAMDRLYARIEAAQEAAGDPRKLIQFYKNHLAIKEALGDREGQLGLIDHIGNRYFQLGDAAPAKEYYEMGMKLRLEMEQARSRGESAEPAASGTAKGGPDA